MDQKNDPNKRLCATGSKSTIYDTDTSDEDIDGLVSNQLTHTQMCASFVQGGLRGLASPSSGKCLDLHSLHKLRDSTLTLAQTTVMLSEGEC